jgi:proteasome lid subunit RPN8/RPN11
MDDDLIFHLQIDFEGEQKNDPDFHQDPFVKIYSFSEIIGDTGIDSLTTVIMKVLQDFLEIAPKDKTVVCNVHLILIEGSVSSREGFFREYQPDHICRTRKGFFSPVEVGIRSNTRSIRDRVLSKRNFEANFGTQERFSSTRSKNDITMNQSSRQKITVNENDMPLDIKILQLPVNLPEKESGETENNLPDQGKNYSNQKDKNFTEAAQPAPSENESHLHKPTPYGEKPPQNEKFGQGSEEREDVADRRDEKWNGPFPVNIYVRKTALEQAKHHSRSVLNKEVGGILLGQMIHQPAGPIKVVIVGIVRANKAISRPSSLNFTPEAWADIWNHIDHDPLYSDEKTWRIVGWYHTHPSYGIFLSSYDLYIQENFFKQPGHVALVLDPVFPRVGFFCWDPQIRKILRYPNQEITNCNDDEIQAVLQSPTDLPSSEIATDKNS